MRSNYRPLSEFIREVKERNLDGNITTLLGINIDKYFMPSVANIVGTDLTVYKVVKKGQFACNRMHVGRDKRLPVALSKSAKDFIVSPAYDVFEIIDESVLHPEYLMMWFSRKEFDRNAWFYTDADIRGGLSWSAFCDMQIPVPSIEKQKKIVAEYSSIVNRIKINEQLNKKLEETAQAIYKQWFIDFEFPNENGNPYKSSGGEMTYIEELDKEIPNGWRIGSLSEVVDIIDGDRGKNYPGKEEFTEAGYCLFLNAGNVTTEGFNFTSNSYISKEKDLALRKGKLKRYDVVLTTRGTVGNVAYYSNLIKNEHIRINSGMVLLRAKKIAESSIYVYLILRSLDMKKTIENYLTGSAQPQLPIRDLVKIPVLIPNDNVNHLFNRFSKVSMKLQNYIDVLKLENLELNNLVNMILSKLTMI